MRESPEKRDFGYKGNVTLLHQIRGSKKDVRDNGKNKDRYAV